METQTSRANSATKVFMHFRQIVVICAGIYYSAKPGTGGPNVK